MLVRLSLCILKKSNVIQEYYVLAYICGGLKLITSCIWCKIVRNGASLSTVVSSFWQKDLQNHKCLTNSGSISLVDFLYLHIQFHFIFQSTDFESSKKLKPMLLMRRRERGSTNCPSWFDTNWAGKTVLESSQLFFLIIKKGQQKLTFYWYLYAKIQKKYQITRLISLKV